ncbi:MAG: polyamine aminopropyltransferase [Acidobacteriota bacterium]|jgi:spermidine synthase|nr:polyamine aminopropyltransferase [Acidobacteriota bacterium]
MSHWFEEQLDIAKGRALRIRTRRLLEKTRSDFQEIEVYDTDAFGRMLVHDGVIMLTEFDEAHYHEMIAHVALITHPDPRDVLVIGGGDGGTLREVLRHAQVRNARLCEIDPMVVEVCRRHFPGLASGFNDPRVTLHFEDGAEFIRRHTAAFDLIIVDSSDPVGPAEVLFRKEFYSSMRNALKPGGIVVTQSESMLYHAELIGEIADFCRTLFPLYRYYYTLVPTYPSGLIGFSFCSLGPDPLHEVDLERITALGPMHYYSAEIHRAAFTLPAGAQRIFKD